MNRPLRFAMVTTFYPPYSFGGDGSFVRLLSKELAERGHQVTIIHCPDAYRALAGGEPRPLPDYHPNISVQPLRSLFPLVSLVASHQTGKPALYGAQLRQLLGQPFDVIHFHNVSLIGGPGVLALGSGLKLYTMHEHWLVCQTHVLFRYNRAPCVSRHCTLCALSYKRPPQWWRLGGAMEAAVSHVDLFLAPSRFIEEKHREHGFKGPMLHMPLFVPGPPARPAYAGSQTHTPYFLFVGRLERLKGLHTLIPVFRRYPRARLLVAGTGSQESSLRDLAAGCSNIEFLGYLGRDRLDPLLINAAALLFPSLTFESSPLAVLEALSRGTPVIAKDHGPVPDILRESGAGFPYETDEELVARMDRVLDTPGLRQELGGRAYDAWNRFWSPKVHMDRYLAVVEERLASRTPAQSIADRDAG